MDIKHLAQGLAQTRPSGNSRSLIPFVKVSCDEVWWIQTSPRVPFSGEGLVPRLLREVPIVSPPLSLQGVPPSRSCTSRGSRHPVTDWHRYEGLAAPPQVKPTLKCGPAATSSWVMEASLQDSIAARLLHRPSPASSTPLPL